MKLFKQVICNLLLAMTGSVVTLVQISLLLMSSDGFCFNEGCKVVDSLTAVPPVVINLLGFCFFQIAFWGQWMARNGSPWRDAVLRLLLLGGVAVEGVLVSFQYFVAQTFCSYCLVILTLVVLLNLFSGWRQIFTGCAVFLSVFLAFSVLKFNMVGEEDGLLLSKGSIASIESLGATKQHYLFFSSTCPHCETVIEELGDGGVCSMRFNPIDKITADSIAGAKTVEEYSVDVNRRFLKGLGIDEIPVLVIEDETGIQVIKGGDRIQEYIQFTCQEKQPLPFKETTESSHLEGLNFLDSNGSDDSCSVSGDCENPFIEFPGK
jgi:hypothetical protein